ncbi:hypothetical protein ACWAT4_26375 [Bradyrhizobium manausense]
MAGIWWDQKDTRLIDFSALTRAKGTVITIKLETAEPFSLASIVADLKRAAQEQSDRQQDEQTPKRSRPASTKLCSRPLLALPFLPRSNDE